MGVVPAEGGSLVVEDSPVEGVPAEVGSPVEGDKLLQFDQVAEAGSLAEGGSPPVEEGSLADRLEVEVEL